MKPLLRVLALSVVVLFVSIASAGSYLNRAALLFAESRRANDWVLANLDDKELAEVAHAAAAARVKAARGMSVPKEVVPMHPHLLLSLESTERALAAASAGEAERVLLLVRTSRDEEAHFRAQLAKAKLTLPTVK